MLNKIQSVFKKDMWANRKLQCDVVKSYALQETYNPAWESGLEGWIIEGFLEEATPEVSLKG